MSWKIGLISDVHACAAPLMAALEIFRRAGVDQILCAGDIAGYGTELEDCVALLRDRGCEVLLGNHDIWMLEQLENQQRGDKVARFLRSLPRTLEYTIEHRKVLAVHASPPDSVERGITILDQFAETMPMEIDRWTRELAPYSLDVLVVGHTHQVFAELLGHTLVINPGSTRFNHTCAVLDFPELKATIHPLPGKSPRKVWHWGMMSPEERRFC